MSAMSNSEFARFVNGLAETAERFEPTASYDPDGDCIEFIAKPDNFYAERIDDLVTVYYGRETGQIVGSLVKGVSKFYSGILQKIPGFKIEVKDGSVLLEHMFLARLWAAERNPDDLIVIQYRKLIEVAEETKAKVRLELLAA